jgi:hypothetical protein
MITNKKLLKQVEEFFDEDDNFYSVESGCDCFIVTLTIDQIEEFLKTFDDPYWGIIKLEFEQSHITVQFAEDSEVGQILKWTEVLSE